MARSREGDGGRERYTIPSSSGWFRWDEIHEPERRAFPEFFEGSSAARNPRIYKEYRDFIINRYREDPSRRLTFTEVRKSLVGDVGSLRKLFRALEAWGLINFGAPVKAEGGEGERVVGGGIGDGKMKIVVEGTPSGVQVLSPWTMAHSTGSAVPAAGDTTSKLPPLTSYNDVFGEWIPGKGHVCGVCGEKSGYDRSQSSKDFAICSKCFEKNENKEGITSDEAKLNDHSDGDNSHLNAAWTDSETLLLLEGVLKHGDDWELISQHVRTKKKIDCIARLVQLPFGEQIMNFSASRSNKNSISETIDAKSIQGVPSDPVSETNKTRSKREKFDKINVDESVLSQSSKRRRILSFSDAADPLMKQVAFLSMIAGPHIASTAADTAVTALCNENAYARKAFTSDEEEESAAFGGLSFRIRAAIATALGGAAARAKLLADQEDREIEHLMSTIIDTQLEKMSHKMEHFEELTCIMEAEYKHMQQLSDSILDDWIQVLQQSFQAGIPRWRDTVFPKSLLLAIL